MLVLLLFFCSGATALVYEVVWSKYLALLLGSTIQAQTVVLAAFMGGLALGNKLFSRHADRSRNPLAVYGAIEIATGLYAFFFPLIYRAADAVFASVGSNLLDHSGALLLLKGLLSALLLLGPTILMGGTLPVLAGWLQRTTPDAGRRSARFYATNSLGAVCGAGLTGFVLVRWLGLRATMELTAIVNVLIGFIAIMLGKMQAAESPAASHSPEAAHVVSTQPAASAAIFRWSCVLVALTGAVSMGLEVLASRCLCLIFGASLQVFAIVLMAFILGIGFGSSVIASPRRKQWPHEITTVLLLLAAAALLGVLVYNIENLVKFYIYTQSGLNRTSVGYRYHQILTAVISIFVLGLPAAALGSVLPLWIRAVPETSGFLGDHVGRLLTWNTLGAVGGVLFTGFVLMPRIGLRGSFAALGMVLAVAALLTALASRKPVAIAAGVLACAFLVMVSLSGGEGWRYVFSAGIFRQYGTDYSFMGVSERPKLVQLLFYEDAADATVSVEHELAGPKELVLRIDGKPDATSHGDLSTQVLLAQLPLLAKPGSKEVFCFGMGSGITAGCTLGYPIDHLTIAENCEPVLRAVRLFDPYNRGVATNSRVRIYHEDARTVLKLSAQKYDVVISEPSNPWMAGVGSVFSREFYQLVAGRLTPGGVMAQWFHTYEMDDSTVNLIMRTFSSVFPQMEIWDVDEGDIVMLGSKQPWKSGVDVYRRAFELDQPRSDLAAIGLLTPESVLARRFASQRTTFAIPGPGPMQKDDLPILEYDAPRAFYLYLQRRGVERLQKFDERTWQSDLALPEDKQALAGLDNASLKAIFATEFFTMDQDLQTYVRNRIEGKVGAMIFGNRVMPCSFQGTNGGAVVYAPPSMITNATARQLYSAEAMLRTDPANAAQAVEGIKSALDGLQGYKREGVDWSASYYADLAVKTSLRLGNTAQARAILLRGLQLEPDSDELSYLSRILVHQGILQASDVPSIAVR